MKKLLIITLSLVLILALGTACGQEEAVPNTDITDTELLELAGQAAEWIASNPDASDTDVQGLCDDLGVDTVCFVGADGVIALSNEVNVIGYDLAEGEQSSEFLVLLEGETTELAQEAAPRGFDGANYRFVGVSGGLEGGLTQVGLQVAE